VALVVAAVTAAAGPGGGDVIKVGLVL